MTYIHRTFQLCPLCKSINLRENHGSPLMLRVTLALAAGTAGSKYRHEQILPRQLPAKRDVSDNFLQEVNRAVCVAQRRIQLSL